MTPSPCCMAIILCGLTFGVSPSDGQEGWISTVTTLDGGHSMTVQPGDSFALAVRRDNADETARFDSFFLLVHFSAPGIVLHAYDFPGTAFVAGSLDDFTIGYEFEAAASVYGNTGGIGTLITMDLAAPLGFPLGIVEIDVIPDCYKDSHCVPDTGETFLLNVVPEPLTVVLLGVGGLIVVRRSRSRAD